MEDTWELVFGPRKKGKKRGTRIGTGKRGKKKVKRKEVSKTREREIAFRSDGSCEFCRKSFSGDIFDPRTLGSHLHHIDGNRANNKKSNLILLCPDCHDMADRGEISRSELRNSISGFGLRL